ncbi:hypothetical protein [Capnocytophaga sp.]
MEKIIILLLIVVILLLLSDKMPITLSKKRTPQPKATPIPKTAPPSSVMGESRFVPPAKIVPTAIPLTEKEQQDILTEWEEEPTINLEDEEEDLRSYRTEAEDNDFAMGLSFEELGQLVPLLTNSNTSEVITPDTLAIAQKVENTNLLEALELAMPEATAKISALLEKYLPKPVEEEEIFDIEEFV